MRQSRFFRGLLLVGISVGLCAIIPSVSLKAERGFDCHDYKNKWATGKRELIVRAVNEYCPSGVGLQLLEINYFEYGNPKNLAVVCCF